MSSQVKIVVVGSINTDLTTYLENFPKENETVMADNYETAFGGKGLNQAVAAARFGAQVTMVGCVGQDDFGRRALRHLNSEGMDTSYIARHENQPTGVATIQVDKDGNNMISVVPGANRALSANHVEAARAVIHKADVVLTQGEIGMGAISRVLEMCNQLGVKTILNPAPVRAGLKTLVPLANVLTPNESETEVLGGVYPRAGNIKAAIDGLLALGARDIVITCGARGSIVAQDGKFANISTFPVTAVDTTGAGDVFNGVLAVGLASGLALNAAASQASAAAAISVTQKTANAAPTRAQTLQFIKDCENG